MTVMTVMTVTTTTIFGLKRNIKVWKFEKVKDIIWTRAKRKSWKFYEAGRVEWRRGIAGHTRRLLFLKMLMDGEKLFWEMDWYGFRWSLTSSMIPSEHRPNVLPHPLLWYCFEKYCWSSRKKKKRFSKYFCAHKTWTLFVSFTLSHDLAREVMGFVLQEFISYRYSFFNGGCSHKKRVLRLYDRKQFSCFPQSVFLQRDIQANGLNLCRNWCGVVVASGWAKARKPVVRNEKRSGRRKKKKRRPDQVPDQELARCTQERARPPLTLNAIRNLALRTLLLYWPCLPWQSGGVYNMIGCSPNRVSRLVTKAHWSTDKYS